MLERFLPRIDFDSYEDFKANYKVTPPQDFNFAYDIVDAWAKEEPDKRALLWCNDHDEERTFTFTDISKMSNQVANMFRARGLKKGDVVMLILRRRWEYWITAVGLMKLGVIIVPGTLQLTKKDIAYRANAASIKAFVCVDDAYVIEQMELALPEAPCIESVFIVDNKEREGWVNFNAEIAKYPDTFERPTDDQRTVGTDLMQIYFTSGTT
jgi:acetyl-CoA synthetase